MFLYHVISTTTINIWIFRLSFCLWLHSSVFQLPKKHLVYMYEHNTIVFFSGYVSMYRTYISMFNRILICCGSICFRVLLCIKRLFLAAFLYVWKRLGTNIRLILNLNLNQNDLLFLLNEKSTMWPNMIYLTNNKYIMY